VAGVAASAADDPKQRRFWNLCAGAAPRHVPGRDDATPEDIARRGWKATWSRYIRVHHAEFVAGTMANGVSLNELMGALGTNSFSPTQRNASRGEGNTDGQAFVLSLRPPVFDRDVLALDKAHLVQTVGEARGEG
jgi:hypothetical protein